MEDFKVSILGCGSAVPTSWHNPSCQIVYHKGRQFMIDCGEGSQMQMIRFGQKYKKLDHIFISHLHGDHYYGLIGLINSFHLMRREKPLKIFCPAELQTIIELQLKVSNTNLFYPLHFHHLVEEKETIVFEDPAIFIKAFPLKHSLPVWGFLVKEKPKLRRINKSFIKDHDLKIEEIKQIKLGGSYTSPDGKLFAHEEITTASYPARSYAYCSDTSYQKSTAKFVDGVDLLYHESTFDNSQEDLAAKTLHSTASQAAQVAKEAHAGTLLLGHYSARFSELDILLEEAKEIFENSQLSEEGKTYVLDYK